ncbi:class I SAM-dependent DNA methyltransferase [Mangrovibacillus cuniculi]|uniref:Class I SAM-dependent methyltransferase n=1 Tax=Mangrovibacillus cuniculi TaxID=2593652 RepID=A0A7S8CBK1_9BACI|nr:class I SAM-dependent methyltransferase [Mangrovibacillus cuniculi]QPC46953.1 class I SAM-dependent methyltransferase [Mangrovibacillus cuniculi]
MSYQRFALVYDELMEDVPYDHWLTHTINQVNIYNENAKTVADIGCGTGTIAIELAKKGYDVTAVDLSDDMLFIASEKAQEQSVSLSLYQQDMRELSDIGPFDVVTIFLDSLNYVTEKEEVIQTLQRVYDILTPGGLLLFDMHTTFKVKEVFENQSFSFAGDDISYIWTSVPSGKENGIYHDLDFFLLEEQSGLYERFSETHEQRAYEEEWMEEVLQEIGFSLVNKVGDFQADDHPGERVFYTVKK